MWDWQETRDRLGLTVAGMLLMLFPRNLASAQIAGDGTLGTQVNGELTAACTGTCIITNGASRGRNLFHSFRQFSLPNGGVAGFATPPTIQNVIVRVTGQGNAFISNINGTIVTTNAAVTDINPANFFLINPNGILFGPNARLLIGNSFLATTANQLQFADGTEFRINDPTPLLTISGPVGLQFNGASGSIQMQRSFLSTSNTSFSDFALVGGDITLNNTTIRTPGRRVELGGVAESGNVGLMMNGNSLSLSFSEKVGRSNVSVADNSLVQVTAVNGGSIAVNAKDINLIGSSIVDAGILPNVGSVTSQAGNIILNASGRLTLGQRSLIRNLLFPGATGNSGDIIIVANSLQITDGSQIAAGILGNGNAGNISILVNEAIFIDGANRNFPSGILTPVGAGGIGNAGNIQITAKVLSLTNGGQVQALVATNGNGSAGNINIDVSDTLSLDGIGGNQLRSGIFSDLEFMSVGKGGIISITARSLQITNGAALIASTDGRGNAGSIRIQARDRVLLDGSARNGFNSSIISGVGTDAMGKGGNISIDTGFLSVTNGAFLQASTDGKGHAGNITVEVANNVALDGVGSNGIRSGVFTNVGSDAIGRGSDISITTGSLSVTNGAALFADTDGQGNAGNINIQARNRVLFNGVGGNRLFSGAFSGVAPDATGEGGNINITTPSLLIINNAILNARTDGQGNAGNILITADVVDLSAGGQLQTTTASANKAGSILLNVSDLLTLSGVNTGLFASTAPGSSGNGGSILIEPRDVVPKVVTIQDGATIAVNSQGSGIGGSIRIQTDRVQLRDRGKITAETASSQGGNITLDVKDIILLRQKSLISATAGTAGADGNGGNIKIDISQGFIVGIPLENSDIIANASKGKGGRVDINPKGIFGIQKRDALTDLSDITASSESGPTGTVNITPPDVDPNRGLVPLPVAVTDPSNKIDQQCAAGTSVGSSQFVVRGQGGLPVSPQDNAKSTIAIARLATIPANPPSTINAPQKTDRPISNPASIIEAQIAIRQANGLIRLAATPSNNSSIPTWSMPNCQRRGE